MKTTTAPYAEAHQLRTPEEMAAYVDAWLGEAPVDAEAAQASGAAI